MIKIQNRKILVHIIILLLIGTGLVNIASSNDSKDTGLVGYWTFDEGSGTTTYDSSGNNNEGTILGATWKLEGVLNGSISFDGVNDYVNVQDDPSLNFHDENQFSICVWFKRNSINNPDSEKILCKSQTSSNAGYSVHITPDNEINLRCRTGGYLCDIFSNKKIIDTGWHHTVVIWNSGTQHIYIDGIHDKTVNHGDYSIKDKNKDLEIGIHYGSNHPLNAVLDEIRIYERALTENEIIDLFTGYFSNYMMFGKIDNIQDDASEIITFEAVSLKVISFSPFQFVQYNNNEETTILEDKIGLMTTKYIFALCKSFSDLG